MQKRRVLINALASAGQVVVNAVVLFLFYRFLHRSIGPGAVGVYAVVLASTQVGHLTNLGLAGGAVKFVSQYLARGDRARVALIIQTSVVSLGLTLTVVVPLLYPALRHVLPLSLEAASLPDAFAILPYALASFWLATMAGLLQSCIDGFQRVDLRNALVVGSTVLLFGLALWWVPERGLVGLAQAQLAQSGALALGCWITLRWLMPDLPAVPWRWRRGVFREVLGYSLQFQGISLAILLFDPVTKFLLAAFGGNAAAGYFEYANKMVFQLRNLIVNAHRALVPTLADLHERAPEQLRGIYQTSLRLVLVLIALSLPPLAVLTPLAGRVWLGAYSGAFTTFGVLLFAGWFLNMLANPAYYANMGTGELRWNVWGHVVIGVGNATLGWTLGRLFGGVGVVVGFVVALLVGSALIAERYQHAHDIRWRSVVEGRTLGLLAAAAAGLGVDLLLYRAVGLPSTTEGALGLGVLLVTAYAACVALPAWRHPVRAQLQGWLAHLRLSATPS